jgi:hypothetical protein
MEVLHLKVTVHQSVFYNKFGSLAVVNEEVALAHPQYIER